MTHCQDANHHDLLQYERDIGCSEKPVSLKGKKYARCQQSQPRPKRTPMDVLCIEFHSNGLAKEESGAHARVPQIRRYGLTYLLPQHRSMPTLVSLLSTPLTALAEISVTPVSV